MTLGFLAGLGSPLEANEIMMTESNRPPSPPAIVPLRPPMACPSDIDVLTALLIRDLPSYTNRVLQRSVGEVRQNLDSPAIAQYRPAYVLVASQPELVPIDLSEQVYTTALTTNPSLQQVFLSTLERQYTGTEIDNIRHFHWLFLTPAETGWHLALMFSTIDDEDITTPILPPRESSNGSVGKGIQMWLRDCRASAIEPIE